MISNRIPLAAALLAVGALFLPPASARAIGEGETQQDVEGSHALQLKVMARRLMVRVEEHRARITRLENLIRYHRLRNQAEEVRKLEVLKRREVESFERTLAEIHRLLGSQDFERVSSAVRYLLASVAPDEATAPAAGEASAEEASLPADRAGAQRLQASIERSVDRQLMLERARASSRMQLSQRLKAARDQQLRLIAQQQQRFQRPPEATAARERGANASPMGGMGARRAAAQPGRRP
jgi:hypothetical protein